MPENTLDLDLPGADAPSAALQPYERGLPASATVRATVGRFLPASLVSLASLFAVFGIPVSTSLVHSVVALTSAVAVAGVVIAVLMFFAWLTPADDSSAKP